MLKNQHKAVHVFIHQDRHFYFARIWDLALFIKSVAELPFSVNLFVNYRKNNLDLWSSSSKMRCKDDSLLFSSTAKHKLGESVNTRSRWTDISLAS